MRELLKDQIWWWLMLVTLETLGLRDKVENKRDFFLSKKRNIEQAENLVVEVHIFLIFSHFILFCVLLGTFLSTAFELTGIIISESFQLLPCITFWKMDLTRPSYLKLNQQNKLPNCEPETSILWWKRWERLCAVPTFFFLFSTTL